MQRRRTDCHDKSSSTPLSARTLTIDEVATLFAVSRRAVLEWIADGRLEALRIAPRTIRVTVDAVQMLLDESRKEQIEIVRGRE